MKIFAIRDRMLDYFQKPWLFERDRDFVSAVAQVINVGGDRDGNIPDYARTPEHFEIWQLGTIDVQTGAVQPALTIITNCASLIRGSVREDGERRAEGPAAKAGGQPSPTGRGTPEGDPNHPSIPDKAPATSGKAGGARKSPGGSDRVPAGGKRVTRR